MISRTLFPSSWRAPNTNRHSRIMISILFPHVSIPWICQNEAWAGPIDNHENIYSKSFPAWFPWRSAHIPMIVFLGIWSVTGPHTHMFVLAICIDFPLCWTYGHPESELVINVHNVHIRYTLDTLHLHLEVVFEYPQRCLCRKKPLCILGVLCGEITLETLVY